MGRVSQLVLTMGIPIAGEPDILGGMPRRCLRSPPPAPCLYRVARVRVIRSTVGSGGARICRESANESPSQEQLAVEAGRDERTSGGLR